MKPNASDCSCRASAPSSTPSWAKVVLQEFSIAWLNGILSVPQSRPSLSISPELPVVCGSWYVVPPGTSLS